VAVFCEVPLEASKSAVYKNVGNILEDEYSYSKDYRKRESTEKGREIQEAIFYHKISATYHKIRRSQARPSTKVQYGFVKCDSLQTKAGVEGL